MYDCAKQRTIACEVGVAGVGLHSGQKVNMKIKPAEINSGITFKRVDLPGQPEMPASYKNIDSTFMCTSLNGAFKLMTVEHFLAAIAGLGIDNLLVEIDAAELPILDGSSEQFVFLLQAAGITMQSAKKIFLRINKPCEIEQNGGFIKLKPYSGLKINFQIDYKHPAFSDGSMSYEMDFNKSYFSHDIASARTYGFISDFENLRSQGLIQGGSMQNAMVFDQDKLINPEGFRFNNECVRHKILDVLGDLKLLGYPLLAELNCFKSGHTLNHMAVKKILSDSNSFDYIEL